MANISFTAVPRVLDVAGIRRRAIVGYTGPASYATGGDPTTAGDYKLGLIEDIPEQIVSNGTSIYSVVFNATTSKLQWFDTSTRNEVANATNLSTYTGVFEIVGY